MEAQDLQKLQIKFIISGIDRDVKFYMIAHNFALYKRIYKFRAANS